MHNVHSVFIPNHPQNQYEFIYTALLYEYLHGDLDMDKSELKEHFEKLSDAFPDSEESYLDKEFRVCVFLNEAMTVELTVNDNFALICANIFNCGFDN